MFQYLRRFWPASLRMQLMLVLLPIVGLPIIATGYMLKIRGHETFIEEKRLHLQGINTLLARHLATRGGYEGLMRQYAGADEDRQGKIDYLHRQLYEFCDQVAESFSGAGVGYFHLGLKAIVTYGPSSQYDKTVGITIPPDHPGWQVMASGMPMTVSGGQVRGNIMNAMRPIKENGQVVGYIWTNELIDDIERQAGAMRLAVQTMTLVGFGLSLGVVFFVVAQLTNNLEKIKKGLACLRFDLGAPIAPIKGEIGEIVDAINGLARSLLETRSMHDIILDSLADAVITVDSKNIVTFINPAGCELFRCEPTEVVGKPYSALFRSNANFSSPIIDTLQTGREHRGVEVDYPLPHRTPHVVASTSVLNDGRRQKLGVVAVIRDITEQFQLRRRMARTERLAAVGEVAANIAHEMRTPLTSIRGFVQYLQGSSDPREWQEYGDIIIREVDGLNRIVSELLDLVHLRPLQLALTDINQVVRETLLLARDNASAPRIRFILELNENLPLIELDRSQIKQVLLNIIINGIQAIPETGEIVIRSAMKTPEKLGLSISDNGSGIPEAIRERIFDPFFSTKPTGTGLGMAIARRIVDNHNGTIEIDSAEGYGTTITLLFPVRTQVGSHESRLSDTDR